MELWIRSQDKTKLVKVNDVYIDLPYDFGRDTYAVYSSNKNYFENDKPLVLGRYKTKERTLEVLDEIQNILMPKYIINPKSMKFSKPYEENGMILMDCNADTRLEQLSTYVYEMPKE